MGKVLGRILRLICVCACMLDRCLMLVSSLAPLVDTSSCVRTGVQMMLAFGLIKKRGKKAVGRLRSEKASSAQQEYLRAMCCQRQFSCVLPRLFSLWCCHWCETGDVFCVCSHSVRNRLLPGRAECVCKTPLSLPVVVLRPARPGREGALEGVATTTTLRDSHPHGQCVVSKKGVSSGRSAVDVCCVTVALWRMCLSAWRPSISVPQK